MTRTRALLTRTDRPTAPTTSGTQNAASVPGAPRHPSPIAPEDT